MDPFIYKYIYYICIFYTVLLLSFIMATPFQKTAIYLNFLHWGHKNVNVLIIVLLPFYCHF